MNRLFLLMLSIVSPTCAGVGVVVALVSGNDTLKPILIAAAIGFLLSIPVTYFVSNKISEL